MLEQISQKLSNRYRYMHQPIADNQHISQTYVNMTGKREKANLQHEDIHSQVLSHTEPCIFVITTRAYMEASTHGMNSK